MKSRRRCTTNAALRYLHEMGWRNEVVEMQLAHKDKDKTRATYHHAKSLPERREMVQAWSDWLETIEIAAVAEKGLRLVA
jgi:hypothetical protein